MVLAAFLVALITLVGFGSTLPAVIAGLGLEESDAEADGDAIHALMRRLGESAVDELGPVGEQTVDGEPLDPAVVRSLSEHVLPRLLAGSERASAARPGQVEQSVIVQRRYLDAMREALAIERSIGAHPSHTYRRAEALLDSLEHRMGA